MRFLCKRYVSSFHFCLLSSFDLVWIAMLLAISKLGSPVVWASIILIPADVSCLCFSLPIGLIQGISPFALPCQAAAHWQCKYVRQALTHSCLSWCWHLTWHQLAVMPSGLVATLCHFLLFIMFSLNVCICGPDTLQLNLHPWSQGVSANLYLPSSRLLIQNCCIFCSMYEWQFESVWLALHIPAQHMPQPWLWLRILFFLIQVMKADLKCS